MDFKYPPTPEIRPPPPTDINTESMVLSSFKISKPRVPCPETIFGSLYGEIYVAPVFIEIFWACSSALIQSFPKYSTSPPRFLMFSTLFL